MLLVRVRVDGREEASDALRTQMEGSLAVRRGGSVGRDRDVRHVVSRPALRLLVPPNNGFRAGIGLAVLVARCSVVKDAYVVRPGPPEAGIQTETSRIRSRVATLRKILAIRKHARVDPCARRGGTICPEIADLANKITGLKAGLRIIAQGVPVDLPQDVLGGGVGPKGLPDNLVPRFLRVLDQFAYLAEDEVHDLAVGLGLPRRLHGGVTPLHHTARVADGSVLFHEERRG